MNTHEMDREGVDNAAVMRHAELGADAEILYPVQPGVVVDPGRQFSIAGYWMEQAHHHGDDPVLKALCQTWQAIALTSGAAQIEALRWFGNADSWPSYLDDSIGYLAHAEPATVDPLVDRWSDLDSFAVRTDAAALFSASLLDLQVRRTSAGAQWAAFVESAQTEALAQMRAVAGIGAFPETRRGQLRPEVIEALTPMLLRLRVTSQVDGAARAGRWLPALTSHKDAENNLVMLAREPVTPHEFELRWNSAKGI